MKVNKINSIVEQIIEQTKDLDSNSMLEVLLTEKEAEVLYKELWRYNWLLAFGYTSYEEFHDTLEVGINLNGAIVRLEDVSDD